MNVASIQMDPTQAREKLKEYRGRKHRAADAEYQRVELAYEQLDLFAVVGEWDLTDVERAVMRGRRDA